jgi:hypothetical protein
MKHEVIQCKEGGDKDYKANGERVCHVGCVIANGGAA